MKKLFLATLVIFFVASPLHADGVPIKKLPAPVIKTVQEYFPGAKLISAERENDDGKTVYEVKLKYKDIKLEVDFSASGRILDVDMDD